MTEQHRDQLREAFETHENQAPDPAAVYAKVQELSRKYKRRRLGAQVAGGAALSAGLVAGVINLPTFLPGAPGTSGTAVLPAAAPATSPSAALGSKPGGAPASTGPIAVNEQLAAYTKAGYGYDEAVMLARIWRLKTDDMYQVKAEAGRRLLLGETLPVKPLPDSPAPDETTSALDAKRFDAFFDAGYVWDDAVKMAKLWKIKDPSDAKLEAGKRLLAGQRLPIKPQSANVADERETERVDAFFEAGYDYDDALKLAKLWKKESAYEAKVEGGKRLLAGQTLPIRP